MNTSSSVTYCVLKEKPYSECISTGVYVRSPLIDPCSVSLVGSVVLQLMLRDRDLIHLSSYRLYMRVLEAGPKLWYWSTEKRQNNQPTLLPSLRQHLSPFRQAGEFIRNKVLEKSLQSRFEKRALVLSWQVLADSGSSSAFCFYLCQGRFTINFGSGRWKTFVIPSDDGLKFMCINFKTRISKISVYRSATTLDTYRSCMSGLLSNCMSTDWDKDA